MIRLKQLARFLLHHLHYDAAVGVALAAPHRHGRLRLALAGGGVGGLVHGLVVVPLHQRRVVGRVVARHRKRVAADPGPVAVAISAHRRRVIVVSVRAGRRRVAVLPHLVVVVVVVVRRRPCRRHLLAPSGAGAVGQRERCRLEGVDRPELHDLRFAHLLLELLGQLVRVHAVADHQQQALVAAGQRHRLHSCIVEVSGY
jgi:hypothetical protein